ncbi:GTPase Obg [Madurella mycetomatis]|uniref:GTPase Obg n=1 Tax=Madurella mycetomatis TaxID=100816 RepID=A0A175W7S3_9PEZI|nr:GTPase Obg [Madurella mycetomatis]
MYLSGHLPSRSEICGKCKKSVEIDGDHEQRRMLTEELTERRSNKREHGRAYRNGQHSSRYHRDASKHYVAQDQGEADRTQLSARGIPTDGASQKDFDHSEPAFASVVRADNVESSIATRGSKNLDAQEAQKAVAEMDILGGINNPTPTEQQEPRKSSQKEKSDEGPESCESRQVTQPQEKDGRPGHGLSAAIAANTQQHYRGNSKPKQAHHMGISDMYWASEEGARESEFTSTFGFLGVYDYNSGNNRSYYHCGYDYNHDRPQHGMGATFSGGVEPFPTTYPANCPRSESEDEASRYCASSPATATATSCSQGTVVSSSSNSGRNRMSFATSINTSPDPGGPAYSGHFSTASAKIPSFTKTGQAGMPSSNRHQQRTRAQVWEASSAEAEEIEKAHVKLFDVKPKGKCRGSGSSSTG